MRPSPPGPLTRARRSLAGGAAIALAAVSVLALGAALGGASRDDPPAPIPPAPEPEPAPAPPLPAPAATPSLPTPPPAPLTADGRKKRVHIIEDRFNEWSGTVEAEDSDFIVIDTKGKLKGFYKARVVSIVPLVDPQPGQPGVVHMRDGRVFRGAVVRDEFDFVEIEIEGIRQRFPREAVARTVLTLTPRQFYEEARAAIPPDQYSDRLRLARYLYDNRMYEESREELLSLLELVDLHEAKELLRVVQAQLALGETVDRDDDFEYRDPAGRRSVPTLRETLPDRFLSAEDVNLIRVYEIDFRRPPRVTVTPDLIRRMIEVYATSDLIPASAAGRQALFREDPLRLVRLLFDLKARDLYGEIRVDTEPYALNLFRQRVHNAWLLSNCATSACHGGLDAGRLFLHNRNPKSAQTRYTNLLILERLKLDGLPPLIDWERPIDSLILQYALPRTEARYPHPDVKGWKPVFTGANRRLLEDFVEWVRAMYRPRPDYPVSYEPPQLNAIDRLERVPIRVDEPVSR